MGVNLTPIFILQRLKIISYEIIIFLFWEKRKMKTLFFALIFFAFVLNINAQTVGTYSHELVANSMPEDRLPDGRIITLGDIQYSRRILGMPPLIIENEETENENENIENENVFIFNFTYNYYSVDETENEPEPEYKNHFFFTAGLLTQFLNQNDFSFGSSLQIGYNFQFKNLGLSVMPELVIATGYPYGLEFSGALLTELIFNNTIGFGIGYGIYGNAFPLIQGSGYGSDSYSLHFIKAFATLKNGNLKMSPFINFYFDPFKSINSKNNIVHNELKMGFGLVVSFNNWVLFQ